MHDPIADMLIRIKNAGDAGKGVTSVPYSKLKLAIANVLLREGYISSIVKKGKKETRALELGIAYIGAAGRKPKVSGVELISKLSRRIYYGVHEIHPVHQGYGALILTTPCGILTGKQARKEKVGGEALFKIW